MIRKILNNCLKFIQPWQRCTLCLSKCSEPICNACYSELPWLAHHCAFCGRAGASEGICAKCQQGGYEFDQCFAPFNYQAPVSKLIADLKFKGHLHHARTLSHVFTLAAKDYDVLLPELLIPVPSHPKRIFRRGFNQSIELTRFIAKNFALNWDHTLVKRLRHTPEQNKLKQQERQKNLAHAFHVQKRCPYKHVALVDDVVTTGTTVNTLAKALKEAGVKRVDVWTICESVTKII